MDSTSKLKELQEKAQKAKEDKKIFTLFGHETIRQNLLIRGWVEKFTDKQMLYVTSGTDRFLLHHMVKSAPTYFIWKPKYLEVANLFNRYPYMNTINRDRISDFTTKDGLINCCENIHWHTIDGVSDLNSQRSYCMIDKSIRDEFSEDFKQTIVTGFLTFLNDHEDFNTLFSMTGELSIDCLQFALLKIELAIKKKLHDDIDTSQLFDICVKHPKNQKEMFQQMQLIISGRKKFYYEENIETLKMKVKNLVADIIEQWPDTIYDGHHNIWILKPIGHSCGSGIMLMNNEEKILSYIQNQSASRFVVQKYIERPLLIHNRKFDIRVYFMTFFNKGKVNIWLYKNCYLKFCSVDFNLNNIHKSIHVTNHGVQKNYFELKSDFSKTENMWTLDQFKEYLKSIGKEDIWNEEIFEQIKKNVIAVILSSLEATDLEKNKFELNGADFMITYDFKPNLIEVNSRPDLFFSKVVIKIITDRLMEDLVKGMSISLFIKLNNSMHSFITVIVDYTEDPKAFTGDFELIYSQLIPKVDNIEELPIVGKRLERPINYVNMHKEEEGSHILNLNMNTELISKFSSLSEKYMNENAIIYYKQLVKKSTR